MEREGIATASVVLGTAPATSAGQAEEPRSPISRAWPLALPLVLLVVVLLLSMEFSGAFATRHWTPLAVVALLLIAGTRYLHWPKGLEGTAIVAAWLYAAWTALSMIWSSDPSGAAHGAVRAALYAGLFTLPIVSLGDRRVARWIAWLLALGLGVVVVLTALRLRFVGGDTVLAGRLNAPIGYRNGSAALFTATAVLFLPFAASRRSAVLVRAAAFGGTALALGLAFATQSRGTVLGFAAGVVVLVALGPDRLRRLVLCVVALAGTALIAHRILAPYDGFVEDRIATAAQIREAADAILLLGVGAFVLMVLIGLFDRGLRASDEVRTLARGLVVAGLVLAVVIGAAAFVSRVGNPVTFAQDKVDEFRAPLPTTVSTSTRLGSTSGPRSDLWGIALRDARDHPVEGVGVGGYAATYYLERKTDRNLTDPHSLPLQVLAELGVVGAALFLAWLGGIAVLVARRPSARLRQRGRGRTSVALIGAGAVILTQACVDFLWLIPGLMGLAMLGLGLAVALRRLDDPRREAEPMGEASATRRLDLIAVPVRVVAGLGALAAAALFLSDASVRSARADRTSSPETQLAAANTARALNPFSLTARYLQAGAQERAGAVDVARRTLEDAVAAQPDDHVTYALLGDLETRAGRAAQARSWYRQALARNPGDVGLQQLARG